MIYAIIFVMYIIMGLYMYNDWKKANKAYSVKYNGSRWVVRDKKGRFVMIGKSRFDVMSLGDEL